jgi:2-haloalkanoic acid dehalogenase type II
LVASAQGLAYTLLVTSKAVDRQRTGPVDWVTFDCYGTLIDWEGGVADALSPFLPPPVDRAALAARYITVEAEFEHESYRPYREILAAASGRLMTELGHPLPREHAQVLPDSLRAWRPFPEVPDALRSLRNAGYRLAILSNVDRDLLSASIALLGIEPDVIVTAEDCRSYKPATGHWIRFGSLAAAGPERTVHTAASLFHDIVPAASLGYRTVFVNRRGLPVRGAAPTRAVRTLSSIRAVIEELAAP